jgi:hypothetical protein
MTTLVDPYTSASLAVTNMYAYSRLDAKLIQSEALAVLSNPAS